MHRSSVAMVLLLAPAAANAAAEEVAPAESAEGVAAELANPLSPITTLSAQFRSEFGWGLDDDTNSQLRLQPSFYKPLEGTSAFLLRSIAPLRHNEFPTSETGLGDISLIPYYVPDTHASVFVGIGGALVVPTATDRTLGSEKWSAGPALLIAKPGQPITWGALIQHVWSFAGESDRADVDVTTLQPFATLLLGGGWSTTLTSEATYNWNGPHDDAWTVPLAFSVARVVSVDGRFVNLGVAYVKYLDGPTFAPDYEIRLNATYVIR